MRIVLYISVILIFLSQTGIAQGTFSRIPPKKQYIGIDGYKMDDIMVAQNNSFWCWAASIQMVLKYYDLHVPQDSIVKNVYGLDENDELPDYGATMEVMNKTLNTTDIDTNGVHYSIEATMGKGAPVPAVLIRELSNKNPVIIGYDTGEGGHAVVVTAVSFVNTANGPKITSIVVRDPMPDAAFDMNNGRIEYPGRYLAQRIHAYWIIDIAKYNDTTTIE
jgi:hypothetical protein